MDVGSQGGKRELSPSAAGAVVTSRCTSWNSIPRKENQDSLDTKQLGRGTGKMAWQRAGIHGRAGVSWQRGWQTWHWGKDQESCAAETRDTEMLGTDAWGPGKPGRLGGEEPTQEIHECISDCTALHRHPGYASKLRIIKLNSLS